MPVSNFIKAVVLVLLTGALAAGLVGQGGVWPAQWNWCAAAVGAAGVVAWGLVKKTARAPADRWTVGLAAGLAGWMALQMVPLPGWLVGVVSPARMEIARGLGETGWVTLSVSAAKTFEWALVFVPAVVAFLLGREMGWWGMRWVAVGPAGSSGGTFVNRNHFAGFLEMGLPLALAGALWAWRSGGHGGRAAVKAVMLLGAAAVMVLAIVVSLSRMGFLAALGSVAAMGMLALSATEERMYGGERSWRWVVPAGLVVVGVGLGFVFLPTDELISRFATLAQTEEVGQDTRAEIWRQTGELIGAYPVTGAGLGTYESAFRRYKVVAPGNTVDYAHNDYLQVLAELGLVGFVLALGLVGRVMGKALRVVVWHKESRNWELALGAVGAVTAMLLHSLVDFNMYIPTNVMMMGWICGMAAAPGLREV